MEEKYFAFILAEDGDVELVYWCVTEKEAKDKAEEWKKMLSSPEKKKDVYVGQLLV